MKREWVWFEMPKENGWYAVKYCWDVEEGTFYKPSYFDGVRFRDEDLPINAFAGLFNNEEDAQAFCDLHDNC
jgi:hypothetical protein